MIWDVIVIGAGCAGLSAGTCLAELGFRVLVLERRPILGGRASSFQDSASGEVIDNGQHLFLGCYQETKKYLKRIGTLDCLPFNRSFSCVMFGPGGERSVLKTPPLPAPFHLAWGLLNYQALSMRDRWAMLQVTREVQNPSQDLSNVSVADWLEELGQTKDAKERFWNLLTLATLNVSPDKAPAELLAVVLRKGFLSSSKDSSVGLSNVGLSELHGDPSKKFIEKMHGQVRIRTTVKKILWNGSETEGVELADGQIEKAHTVISAVPPRALFKLATQAPKTVANSISPCLRLQPSPIVSLNVWLERQPFQESFAGLWEREFHWIFRKQAIYKNAHTAHVTLVKSAADSFLSKGREDLIELAENELKPLTSSFIPKVKRAVMCRENAATWVPKLGDSSARLSPQTPLRNFFLAGDWTNTGLPATIEGAVKSGHVAAEYARLHLAQTYQRLTIKPPLVRVPAL